MGINALKDAIDFAHQLALRTLTFAIPTFFANGRITRGVGFAIFCQSTILIIGSGIDAGIGIELGTIEAIVFTLMAGVCGLVRIRWSIGLTTFFCGADTSRRRRRGTTMIVRRFKVAGVALRIYIVIFDVEFLVFGFPRALAFVVLFVVGKNAFRKIWASND